MRGLHRMVVTGAMGGLAAATVAASGAFACSPQTQVVLDTTTVHDSAVVPGQTVKIEVRLLEQDPTAGDVEVVWFTGMGTGEKPRELSILIPRAPAIDFKGVSKTITIPDSPALAHAPYAIVARQYHRLDPTKPPIPAKGPAMLYIVPPRQVAQPQNPSEPTGGAELSRANAPGRATVTRPDGTRTPAGTPAPGVNAPAGSNGAAAVAGAPVPTQTDSALSPQPASAETQQATATFGQPATSPAVAGEPARSASPTSADLWSGLDADKAPSLLDTPVATSDSRAPMGAVLLGAGVIALAGVALAATRRRLAVVTRR